MKEGAGAGIRVRLFAAAADVVGEQEMLVSGAGTVGELIERISDGREQRVRLVLGQCSLLIDGERASGPGRELDPGDTVDILPPFAGG